MGITLKNNLIYSLQNVGQQPLERFFFSQLCTETK